MCYGNSQILIEDAPDMATTLDTKSRILIAADSAANASLVKKLLEDEFGTIAISTDPDRVVEEFQQVGGFLGWEVAEAHRRGFHASWHDHLGVGLPKDSSIKPDRIILSIGELTENLG